MSQLYEWVPVTEKPDKSGTYMTNAGRADFISTLNFWHEDQEQITHYLRPVQQQGWVSDASEFLTWVTIEKYIWDFDKEKYVAAWDNYKEFTATELYEIFKTITT